MKDGDRVCPMGVKPKEVEGNGWNERTMASETAQGVGDGCLYQLLGES